MPSSFTAASVAAPNAGDAHVLSRASLTKRLALAAATVALGATTLNPTANITGAAGISMTLPSDPSISDTLDGTDHIASWSAFLGIVDAL